jgi:DNA-binding transcriptional LysR family regulator
MPGDLVPSDDASGQVDVYVNDSDMLVVGQCVVVAEYDRLKSVARTAAQDLGLTTQTVADTGAAGAAGLRLDTTASRSAGTAGFEPDVRYETADLQAHVALVEGGHAVAILSGLMSMARQPNARMVGLPCSPRRTIFTATRSSLARTPAIAAVRSALAAVVPREDRGSIGR